MFTIRKAGEDDAYEIAIVHVDSWRTTYSGIVPADYLNGLSYENRTKLWLNNLARNDNYVLVAENEAGKIVGFATIGKRDSNQSDNVGDLTSIYLLDNYQGLGIGKQLLEEVFKVSRKLSYKRLLLQVLEQNDSKTFYEKFGAKLTDQRQVLISEVPLNLLTYAWGNLEKEIQRMKDV